MKTVITLFTVVAVLYGLAALAMYLLQRSLIYYPTPAVTHPYPERQITVDSNIKLRVIEVNPAKAEAVIYFGGNAEVVAGTAPDLAAALPNHTIYLVNYRGYGGSDGTPTEQHLFDDAETVFEEIASIHGAKHQNISVIGRSLGSGVACWLASRKPVDRLVLITPYDSILKIAQSAYPIFPVRWLLKDRYESDKYAPSIEAPVLALMAEHDAVIPSVSSQRLLRHFHSNTQSTTFENTGHNDLQTHRDFYPAISQFLEGKISDR